MSLISVDQWLWYIDQFYILFWIRLESGTAYCLSWKYLHWFDIEITSCVLDTEHCEAHSLQVMRTQLETLGEEFKLAGNIWWREPTMLWVWTMGCIGIVKTMAIFGHLMCLRVLWWDVSVLWGQYLHHRHRDLWIIHLILWCAFYRSWDDFGYLYEDDIVEKTLVYIVDWLLQWSKDFSDTTVFGWPTLTMSNRTFYSTLRLEAVRCYLYVENWFGEGTLCSDYVLYSEEGCTDTLCESLRSWEVSQLVTDKLVIHVWMRTSLLWELLEVFRWFWIHLVKLSFVDF